MWGTSPPLPSRRQAGEGGFLNPKQKEMNMSHDKITYDRALPALTKVVEEAGADYVYQPVSREEDEYPSGACLYAHNSKPSCGVGRALVELGWTVQELEDFDSTGGMTFGGLTGEALIECDNKTLALFDVFQTHQDQKVPWGTAFNRAKREAERQYR